MKNTEKKFTDDEIKMMQQAVGEMSEEELQEIVGAGGDINAETSAQCVTWTIQITTKLITSGLFC